MIDINKTVEAIQTYYCRNNDIDNRVYKKLILEALGHIAASYKTVTSSLSRVSHYTAFEESGATTEGALRIIISTDLPGSTVDGNDILPDAPLTIEAVYDEATAIYERIPAISYTASAGSTLYITEVLPSL